MNYVSRKQIFLSGQVELEDIWPYKNRGVIMLKQFLLLNSVITTLI